jgi:hypothetical protein
VLNELKVENENGLYRDMSSGAIINKDTSSRDAYLKQRENILKSREATEKNTKDIQELKGELGDIKQMLAQILQNVQK